MSIINVTVLHVLIAPPPPLHTAGYAPPKGPGLETVFMLTSAPSSPTEGTFSCKFQSHPGILLLCFCEHPKVHNIIRNKVDRAFFVSSFFSSFHVSFHSLQKKEKRNEREIERTWHAIPRVLWFFFLVPFV